MATKIERIAGLAMALGHKHLADDGAVRSRHDFTQRQLMSCLILRAYLKTIYRGLIDRKHSTNPIWRVGRIFRQDGSRWDAQSLRARQGAAHGHCGAGCYDASVWAPVVAA